MKRSARLEARKLPFPIPSAHVDIIFTSCSYHIHIISLSQSVISFAIILRQFFAILWKLLIAVATDSPHGITNKHNWFIAHFNLDCYHKSQRKAPTLQASHHGKGCVPTSAYRLGCLQLDFDSHDCIMTHDDSSFQFPSKALAVCL